MNQNSCNHPEPDEVVVARLVAGWDMPDSCACERQAAYVELVKRRQLERERVALLRLSGTTQKRLREGLAA